MVEDENSLKTAAQDAAAGLLFGSAGGAMAGNVEKSVRGKLLKINQELKPLRKAETAFYKDYNQQVPVFREDLGKIDFTQSGLETVSKHPNAARKFPTLQQDIKNAEYVSYELPKHSKHGIKDNIKGFHTLQKDNVQFLIADTDDGLKYYMSKIVDEPSHRPIRVEPGSSTNIIPPTTETLNPNLENISKKPSSFDEWLEELKRKRRLRVW